MIETESRDEADRCHHGLRRALAESGPVAGIYSTGTGSKGIERALPGVSAPSPIWIGHEASDDHIGDLRSDRMQLAIDQAPKGQAHAALQTVVQSLGPVSGPKVQAKAELRLYSRYNCA